MPQQRKIFLFNDSLLCYNSDSGLLNRYTGRSFFKKIPDENNTGDFISDLCVASGKPVVVIIDSVILAGVYDIKNLKLKIRPEEQHQYNSPWNIAAQFDVNMDLAEDGIKGMLEDYENDHHTGMDTAQLAKLLSDYTSGYPFLVSRLCQIIDESLNKNWTEAGFLEAVKMLLRETNTLFDDMRKKLDEFPNMRTVITALLFSGEPITFNAYDRSMDIARMFNFTKSVNCPCRQAEEQKHSSRRWCRSVFGHSASRAVPHAPPSPPSTYVTIRGKSDIVHVKSEAKMAFNILLYVLIGLLACVIFMKIFRRKTLQLCMALLVLCIVLVLCMKFDVKFQFPSIPFIRR